MHFDWYQATIERKPEEIADCLLSTLFQGGEVQRTTGKNNYTDAYKVISKTGSDSALILFGGRNPHPNALMTSEGAQPFSEVLRANFPEHRVTRADIAEDFISPGAFNTLSTIAFEVYEDVRGSGYKLTSETIRSRQEGGGATDYIGSPTSGTRFRAYDKTAEQRSKLPDHLKSKIPENWARAELQVRPQTPDLKARASLWTHLDFWGVSRWSAKLAERILGAEVARIRSKFSPASDDSLWLSFLAHQYSNHFKRLEAQIGRAAVLDAIGRECDLVQEFRKSGGRGGA